MTRQSNFNHLQGIQTTNALQPNELNKKKTTLTGAEEIIQTSFRLPRSRWKKLQEAAIEERRSAQSIIIEALEEAFSKKGLKF